MKRAILISLALLLASGCATKGGGGISAEGGLQRPVSELPATSERQAGSKIHVDLGTAYFQAGRFGVALDEARVAQAFDPEYAPVYHLFGQIYMYLDDTVAARQNLERAIALAPGDPEINNTYGWFLCASGEERAGIERLAQVGRNPYYRTPTRPYTNAGLCHLRLKENALAESEFLRAVQADPSNTLALFQLASLAYQRGAYEVANGYLQNLQQQAVPTAESLLLGARIARKIGNRENEMSFATQLRSRFPTSKEYETYTKEKSQ